MSAMKMFALFLLIGGALALAYGGFSFTTETHDIKMGSLEVSVDEKKRVNIPMWAGGSAIVLGGLLLAFGTGRRS